MTEPATPVNHTPQPTQNGLIMLSTPGATPHRIPSDVDAEAYAAVPLDEVAREVKDIADGRPVIVEQGHALGRPSRIRVSVAGPRVRVGGSGLVVAEGTISV